MRDGWEDLRFGEVLELENRRAAVVTGRGYPIVGVLGFGRGLIHRDAVTSESTSYREMNVVGPNRVIYSKLKAFEGAITVTPADLEESYASGEFPTFITTPRVQPDYMRLLTQREKLWGSLAAGSKGMGGRRERLNPRDFLTISAPFPPVWEQRRIVDLIAAVDGTVDAAAQAFTSLRATASTLRASVFTASDTAHVGEICSVSVGKQLQSGEALGGLCGYLRAGNIADGELDLREIKQMRVSPDERDRLQLLDGDVVVVEGGNGYGKSAKWGGIGQPMVFQNHVLRLRPKTDRYDTEYLFQWARFCHETGRFKPTGTGLPNLGVGRVRQMSIPEATPARCASVRLLGLLGSAEAHYRAIQRSMRDLRSTMLSALLSGEHEIPESFDRLIEEAL